MQKSVVYIGDFDFIHHNVQTHLVRSNGRMLETMGYIVYYVGVNRGQKEFRKVSEENYCHLPDTFSFKGILKYGKIRKLLIGELNAIKEKEPVQFVILYQAPTFSPILSSISTWCRKNKSKLIVNSADLPVFKHGGMLKSAFMYANWSVMHNIIRKRADGIIAVSSYIERYFYKEGRPSLIIPPIFDGERPSLGVKDKDTEVVFVYAGRPFVVTGRKVRPSGMKDRLDYVMELFSLLRNRKSNFMFKIIGITKKEYLTSLPNHKHLIESLSNNVSFLGMMNHEQTIEQIATADFMINYRDVNKMTLAGYSTKVVESISIGTPVMVNDIGDTFRYLSEKMGFVLTNDTEKNIAILENVCNLSKQEIGTMKDACRNQNPFTESRYIGKLSSFLKEVIAYES